MLSHFKSSLNLLLILLIGGALVACDDNSTGPNMEPEPDFDLRQVSYDLSAVSNSGAVPSGVAATATFQELSNNETLVTLTLDAGSTNSGLEHTAHIHENNAEEGGDIAYFLGPVDGLDGAPGTSTFVVEESFDVLLAFDGYINIHESNAALGVILGQGDIGANAEADITESDLSVLPDQRITQYTLNAIPNEGAVAQGSETIATFRELNSSQTLVKLEMVNGSTETELSHVAHIHNNNVASGGSIAYFLGPIDGLPAAPGVSYALVDESFDFLTDFDGYINLHESNTELDTILAQGNIGANEGLTTLRQASFPLSATSNSGAIPAGVSGTATYWELNEEQTVVTLTLDGGATGADVSHTAHIHFNSVADGGDIAYFLTPIDGSDPDASSARIIDESFDTLIEFDSHINIHESVENISTLVAQGDAGANAEVETQPGLDPVENARSISYTLDAVSNDGLLPDGFSATATFTEIMSDLTIVSLDLDASEATGAGISHTAHIHENSVSEGGGINWYLGAIDGMDPDSKSSYLINESFDTLSEFDGYINIHESLSNLDILLSQGNIGTNAD